MKRSDYLNNIEPEPVQEEAVEAKISEEGPNESWRRWAVENYNREAEITPRLESPFVTSISNSRGEAVGFMPAYTPQDVEPAPDVEPQPQYAPDDNSNQNPTISQAPEPSWAIPMEMVPMAEGPMIEQRIRNLIDECRDPARRRILYRVLAELVDLDIPSAPPGYNPSASGISDAEF